MKIRQATAELVAQRRVMNRLLGSIGGIIAATSVGTALAKLFY